MKALDRYGVVAKLEEGTGESALGNASTSDSHSHTGCVKNMIMLGCLGVFQANRDRYFIGMCPPRAMERCEKKWYQAHVETPLGVCKIS